MTTPTDDELLALPRKLIAYVTQRGEPLPDDEDILAVAHGYIALHERHRAEVERLTRERDEARDDAFSLAANQCHEGYAGEHGDHMCRIEDRAKAAEAALAAERKRCGELEGALHSIANYTSSEWTRDTARAALAGKDAEVTNDQRGQLIRSDERDA